VKPRFAYFDTPPWKYQVGVLYGPAKECDKWVKKNIDPNLTVEEYSDGMTFRKFGKPILIWVKDIKKMSTLVHEILHAVFFILDDRGVILSEESEETYTYTVSDLLDQILKHKKWKAV
jgi:hypothetical protein